MAGRRFKLLLFSRVKWEWNVQAWDEFLNVHFLLCRRDFLPVRSSCTGAFLSGMVSAANHKSSDLLVGSPSAASLVCAESLLGEARQCLTSRDKICAQVSQCLFLFQKWSHSSMIPWHSSFTHHHFILRQVESSGCLLLVDIANTWRISIGNFFWGTLCPNVGKIYTYKTVRLWVSLIPV